jgi:hypothetical protein
MNFKTWLLSYYHKLDDGDDKNLAVDIAGYYDFPISDNKQELKDYLHKKGRCLDCFDRVFSIYEKEVVRHERTSI